MRDKLTQEFVSLAGGRPSRLPLSLALLSPAPTLARPVTCRRAAIRSLSGIKRKSEIVPKTTRLTHNVTSPPSNDAVRKVHSITSSAVASSADGMASPSAFAVLRLMARSNFVGSWIGNSPGFSPLRIRSTYPAPSRNDSTKSAP